MFDRGQNSNDKKKLHISSLFLNLVSFFFIIVEN